MNQLPGRLASLIAFKMSWIYILTSFVVVGFSVVNGQVRVIEAPGDESIQYGDQVAIADNRPVNNFYYQMKRLPPPAPQPRPAYTVPVNAVIKRPSTLIQPTKQVPLKRRGNFPECSLPPDAGDCTGEFIRIFFDDRKMTCEEFYYSGCGGNANRFTSIKACYDICSPHQATVNSPSVLSGKRYVLMPKPGAPEALPMPEATPNHPDKPHYDVYPTGQTFSHADSKAEQVPVGPPQQTMMARPNYAAMNGQQMIQQGAVQPTKVKVYKYSNQGMGGMGGMMGNPMMLGGGPMMGFGPMGMAGPMGPMGMGTMA